MHNLKNLTGPQCISEDVQAAIRSWQNGVGNRVVMLWTVLKPDART